MSRVNEFLLVVASSRALCWGCWGGFGMRVPVPRCSLPCLSLSITLHLKISCPSSPAFNYSRNPICAVPQVKIEMESDYEDTDTEKPPRDMGSETTL